MRHFLYFISFILFIILIFGCPSPNSIAVENPKKWGKFLENPFDPDFAVTTEKWITKGDRREDELEYTVSICLPRKAHVERIKTGDLISNISQGRNQTQKDTIKFVCKNCNDLNKRELNDLIKTKLKVSSSSGQNYKRKYFSTDLTIKWSIINIPVSFDGQLDPSKFGDGFIQPRTKSKIIVTSGG